MSRGPLPDPDSIRRNKPTIPTNKLPAEGYAGEVPEPAYDLGRSGSLWWEWAWKLPQADAWDDGAVFTLSRRAQLEDDLASLELNDDLDLSDLLAGADDEAIKNVEHALETLKRSASGKLAIEKEMRELDRRLGLDPKALAELRWTIVEKDAQAERPTDAPAQRRHLKAVSSDAAAG